MGMNFPNSPTPGQVYTPVGGYSYVFLDGVWRIVQDAQSILTADTRNRIVNGAMQISQENGSAILSAISYPADQWLTAWTTSGTPRTQRVDTEPEGKFVRFNSHSVVDAAVAATDYAQIAQRVEGINTEDFLWGTSGAKPVVLRFTGRTNAAGGNLTIGVSIRNDTPNRSFVKNVVLTSAWQDFVVVIPGDTSGTWPTGSVNSAILAFACMVGSTYLGSAENTWLAGNFHAAAGVSNIMGTSTWTMDIKNVGLYLDPVATGVPPRWQMPDEAEELRACQRYYWLTAVNPAAPTGFRAAVAGQTLMDAGTISFPVTMRTQAAGAFAVAPVLGNCSAATLYSDLNSSILRVTATAAGGYRANSGQYAFNARM